jgi:hypothetical protein
MIFFTEFILSRKTRFFAVLGMTSEGFRMTKKKTIEFMDRL